MHLYIDETPPPTQAGGGAYRQGAYMITTSIL
jgi:hypothetical protein